MRFSVVTQTLLLALAVLCPRPAAGQEAALDAVQLAMERYFEMQKLISKERSEWKLGKELLRDRVELMKGQIEEIRRKVAEERAETTEADVARASLQSELDSLMEVHALQQQQIGRLEDRTRALLVTLPEGVRSKLELLSQKLPKPEMKAADIRASMAERYQNVLGILNEVGKFNADIFVTNERHLVSGGRQAEVRTMYVGLGQAYYAGSGETADSGGAGVPGAGESWQWMEKAGIAVKAGRAIRMHAGEEIAAFVTLPVKIVSEAGEGK